MQLERREYASARKSLEPLGEKTGPHQEKALYRLAWCHHYLDEPARVVALHERFARAFAASPLAGEVALLGARAYLGQGQHAKAGEVFRAIAEARPGTPEGELARVSQGECLAEGRKYAEAAALFAAFLKEHPESPHAPRASFGRAFSLENLDRRDEAMPLYRAVAAASRTEAGARAQFQLGQCHAARKEYRDAIVELLQVSAGFSFPEWSSKALLQVAGCFEELEDPAMARKYYEEVIATFPDRDEARLARERLDKLETQ
jgi:TolA-binding protein